ncbi:MAG: ABC transporter substrate-binding protein [Thermodesulfobacteriota bacterium]|nr:ABC transporter substrate-binding protein [Thermodesulfobacteriota bacterium]
MVKRFLLFSLMLSLLIMTASGAWAADKKPVKMIGSAILSGKIGAVAETGFGFLDGAAFVNMHGGINGRKFEVLLEDGQYNIPLCVSIFNRLSASEPKDELFFHGGYGTDTLHAIAERVMENHMVCVDSSMSPAIFENNPRENYPYFFSVGVPYGKQTGAILKFLKASLHKGPDKPKLAFVYIESGVGREPIPSLKKYCKKFNIDLALIEPVTYTQTDYTPTLMKIRRVKADYILLWCWSVPVGSRFFKMARKVMPNVTILTLSTGSYGIFFDTAKEAYDGVYMFSPYPQVYESNNPLVAKALDIIKIKKHPPIKIWYLYMNAFLMSMMSAQAAILADNAGNLSREGCRDAMEGLRDWDAFGLYNGKTLDYGQHAFNRGRILRADFKSKSNKPLTDWFIVDDYLK